MCEPFQETFRRQPTVACYVSWLALTVVRERPFPGGPDRWNGAAVITPISAIWTNALYDTIARKDDNRDDYSMLARNLDGYSHFSSETGTSNTTVFTKPLR
jgi:hypothetical protein